MKVLIVTPARRGSRQGNRITALRWQAHLRALGHRVTVAEDYHGQSADVLLALHAAKSAAAVAAFARQRPEHPIVVVLTGTDIYARRLSARSLASLRAATAIVALQGRAARRLPAALRGKVRVIVQSAGRLPRRVRAARPGAGFPVAVLGHLRAVKDPLRPALAVRRLPAGSRIRLVQAGRAITPDWARRARAEMARNPRYRWLGERSHVAALRLLAASRLLVLPSRSEGGANVLTEAAALGVPVLASRVDGNLGLLGARYPGTFPVGDTRSLRRLLLRAENDPRFLESLGTHMATLARASTPAQERRGLADLLNAINQPSARRHRAARKQTRRPAAWRRRPAPPT